MNKVVAINGSSRPKGNTADLLARATTALQAEGVETETLSLAKETFRGCIGCMLCFENKNRRCAVESDNFNDVLAKMIMADGILLGSPVYFADCSAVIKALIERAGMVARANDNFFKLKVGAAVAAVRRAGAIHTIDSLQHFFTISEMIISGSSYWNVGIGREPHKVLEDEEGLETMDTLGKNMAWLLNKIHA